MHRLVFRGEIAQGTDAAQVKSAVAGRFRLSETQADAMFSGRPTIIKKAQTPEELVPYRDALTSCGALAVIESDEAAVLPISEQSKALNQDVPKMAADRPPMGESISSYAEKVSRAQPEPVSAHATTQPALRRLGPRAKTAAIATIVCSIVIIVCSSLGLVGEGAAAALIFLCGWIGSAVTMMSMRYSSIIAVGGGLIVGVLATILVSLPSIGTDQEPSAAETAAEPASSEQSGLDPLEGVWTCNDWWIGYGHDGQHFRLSKAPSISGIPNTHTRFMGKWSRLGTSHYKTYSEVWTEGGIVMSDVVKGQPKFGSEMRWRVSVKDFDHIQVRADGSGAEIQCRRMTGDEQSDFFKRMGAR